jgi:uncharacterized membrane protein YfcA
MSDLLTHLALAASALAAGVVNSLAGGGTLLTFPALLSVVDPVTANATSTVALMPGSLAGAWGYRAELKKCRRWAAWLTLPSLVGGAAGALLVTRLEEKVFAALVPWLILSAAVLFLMQKQVVRWLGIGRHPDVPPTPRVLAGVVCFQLLVGVYGGYFGAGIGILMITSLGLMGLGDLVEVNALKTFLAACMNGVAVAVFVAEGKVNWPFAASMAAGAVVGGYLGARLGRRMPVALLRWLVIGIGFGLAGYYFARQLIPV